MPIDEILGMNERNFSFIREYNLREAIRLVDNKLKTKRILKAAGLPVAETYKVFRRPEEVRGFDFASLPPSFVVKPNSGFGGKGVMVIYGKTKEGFLGFGSRILTAEEIKLHILDILEGIYSLSGLPDKAYLEERIKPAGKIKRISFRGLADIRVIVFNLVPIMAMLRLPTEESQGRANLHEGAMGVGIDLATGITTEGFWKGRVQKYLPNSKIKVSGMKIDFWEDILLLASEAQRVVGAKFLGVDIALTQRGPLILELNARPGLSIQNVNKEGLKERLLKVKKMKVLTPSKGVRIGKELFGVFKGKTIREGQPVIGLVELVTFFRKKKKVKALAKIDTGATLSAIDFSLAEKLGLGDLVLKAKELRKAYKEKNVEMIQKISEEILTLPNVSGIKKVKSSLGEDLRVKVKLNFRISSFEGMREDFYLAQRGKLKYKVIIGKNIINNFLVNPLKYTSRLYPFLIRRLEDIRPFFALSPRKILGIGVNVFNRLGPEHFVDNYLIAALKYNSEDKIFSQNKIDFFSLEKEGVNVNDLAWNSSILVKHPYFEKLMDSLDKSTAWYIYSPDEEIEKYAKKFGAKLIANPYWLFRQISDKGNFRKILKRLKLPFPRSEVARAPFNFKKLSQKLGLPLFVQLKDSGGGRGNFIINNEEELLALEKNFQDEEIIISEYIKGFSPSITGCVTRWGIFYLPPQLQILDQEELVALERGKGQFCGHDFTSSLIPEKIKKEAYLYIEKVGEYLKDIGFKGIFGLDLLWDSVRQKLYVVECNPRLLGAHPTQTFIQLSRGEIPLCAWHILEFLKVPYEVNYEEVQKQYLSDKFGAQLLVHNLSENPILVEKAIPAGTYSFDGENLKFERKDHSFSSLKENEFIITDGVPFRGRIIKGGKRIFRIITKKSVISKDLVSLNEWAKKLINKIRSEIKIKEIK